MKSFIFDSYHANLQEQQLEFSYVLKTEDKEISFTEKIILPKPVVSDIPPELLDNLLHSLHIMLGISYWKLYCPKEIIIKTKPLSKEQAEFWNIIYTKGLGELFYKNNIDFRNLVSFPYQKSIPGKPVSFPAKNRSLVGIGGGKDSIVTAELLKKNNQDFSTLIIDTQKEHTISAQIAKQIGKGSLTIRRQVDSVLFDLNKDAETYNGHIPISAIYAFIGILSAVLYDYSYVIVSNERSANYGNTEYLGQTINHQWSKTIEFEKLFQEYIASFVTPDVTYFSLLRPYSEYKITEFFSQYSQYFSTFSSCNKNYAIQKELPHIKWCGECPKCAFVFIMLAVFIPKEQLIGIFGQNLLEKDSLLHTYKELLGIEGVKPFECVGTPEEVALAFYKVHTIGEYNQNIMMKMFEHEVLPRLEDVKKLEQEVLESGEHLIPEEFRNNLSI